MPAGSKMEFRVEQFGFLPKTPRTDIRKMFKASYHEMGVYWHKHFRPKHFTHRGATEYGYEERDDRYERRKLRKFGHTYPLVWSGESRMRTRARDVRSNSKRARVVLHANKFNFKTRKSKVRMREEMTRVTPVEADQLIEVFDETMQAEIDRYGRRLPSK